MPRYEWNCDRCSHTKDENRPIEQGPSRWKICPICRKRMSRVFSANACSFKPYVEQNFTGDPIDVTSPRQRDRLCAIHKATYDRSTNLRPAALSTSAIDSVSFEDVAAEMKRSRENGCR